MNEDVDAVALLVEIAQFALDRQNRGANVWEAKILGAVTGIACRYPGVAEQLKDTKA